MGWALRRKDFSRMARDFGSGQVLKAAGILYVFQSIQNAVLEQKIRYFAEKLFKMCPLYDVNSIPEQRRGEAIGLPDRFEEAA